MDHVGLDMTGELKLISSEEDTINAFSLQYHEGISSDDSPKAFRPS